MNNDFNLQHQPELKILSEEQIKKIHDAVLQTLEHTGVKVDHPEAVKLLKDAGAEVDGDRIKIPPQLVEDAIKTAPSRVVVSNQKGEEALFLEGRQVYFGANTDCINIIDPYTQERRPFLRQDGRHAAFLCENLTNIDFVLPCGLYSDVPAGICDRVSAKEMFLNTTKPVLLTCNDAEALSDVIDMATVIAGGPEKLRQNPFIMTYSEPISPLTHSEVGLEKAFVSIESGVPLVYTPMPLSGATAPATLAGTLVTGIAEVLSGLVITQLKNKGASFIVGGVTTIMDMSSMICAYGAPEKDLLTAAWTDMAHYYELPLFGTAGCGDSKSFDEQTIAESSISCLSSALSGANLVHDIGLMESAITLSLGLITITDEILGMVKRIAGGIDVNSETLALDVIAAVGPGGEFASAEHTFKHFRENWFPKIFDRSLYQRWDSNGRLSAGQKTNDKVREIIEQYKPKQLPEEIIFELDKMEDKWKTK